MDGIPMILVPRHFFVNNVKAVERLVGNETSGNLFREPGDRSAREWCAKEAVTHDLSGAEVFRHYMMRLSQRGWGQFTVQELNLTTGYARVQVDNSVFAAEHGAGTGRKVCYMFEGWMEGALGYVGDQTRQLHCQEIQCIAAGAEYCLFEVAPAEMQS